jgi:SP family xylose:H+ symportor-like MFS transporter
MFASQILPALVMFGLVFLVPESPRWLVQRGRHAQAHDILAMIEGEQAASRQIAEIEGALRQSGASTSHVFSRKFSHLLLIGIGLAVFQQITGINIFLYFAPEIFASATGASADVALLQTMVLGVANLAFTVLAIFTVDRVGRRPLMLIGFAGMTLCLIAMATATYNDVGGIAVVVVLVAYVAGFAVSTGPVTWVLLSEIFPANIRAVALGLAVTCNWLANVAMSQTFSLMQENAWLADRFNGTFPFFLYALFGILATVFVYRFVPETRGHSLEEIEAMLASTRSA